MKTFDYNQMKEDKILELTTRINELQQSMNTTIAVIQAEQSRLLEEINRIKQHRQPLDFVDASNYKAKNKKSTK